MPHQLLAATWADLWHPGVLALTVDLVAVYLLAMGPLRRRYGWGPPVPHWRQAAFATGAALLYLAEGTPLHLLAERYLFSAHMVQHLLLTMVLPPLVLLGIPDWLLRPLLRRPRVRAMATALTRPALALVLFNLIYSVWHMPILYNTALVWHEFHMFQHALLVPAAFLMWWPLLSPAPELPRLAAPVQMLYLCLIAVAQMAVFGAVTFADEVLYHAYASAPRLWSISPAADQQAAGIIMKVGSMIVIIPALAIVFFRWAAQVEASDRAAAAAGREAGAPPQSVG